MDSALSAQPATGDQQQPIPQGIATARLNATAFGGPRNDESTGGHPEIKAGPAVSPEVGEIEVIPESPEISPELAEHVERVTRGEIQLPGPIEAGTHEGQPVTIQPSAPQQPNIVLPLTRADFTAGPGQPVSSSWRWLYEFVKRIILMMPGRVVYRSNS